MKFLSVLLAVLASASLAGAQNYVCPAGDSDTTITVNNKAKLTFMVPKKTPHNMDCAANYVLGTCSRVNIKCSFKMKAKGATCVGDKAVITVGGKSTTLCNRKGRYANKKVTGDFSIQVMTDGKKGSKGGKCNIKCTKKGKPKPTTAAPTPPPTTGTVTTEGGEDEVMTRVKGYIDAATCGSVTFSTTECGDTATSYFKEFTYNNKRVLISNNIPDHAAEHDAIRPNPNTRCTGWQFIELPINPSKSSNIRDTRMGTVGLAVTGGAFFNDLSNTDGSLALTNEGTGLDSCLGHSAQAGKYHYHGNINCTEAGAATGANDPDQCVLVGYYNDGVPVYGFCRDSAGVQFTSCYKVSDSATLVSVETASGTYNVAATNTDYTFSADSDCNLDEASGSVHPTTGQYSYFMTTGYPWTPIKWAGDQGRSTLCSAD